MMPWLWCNFGRDFLDPSEDNNESGDTADNCSVFESPPSLIRGSALGNNYLRNDFLSLSRADWRRWTWTAPGGGRGDARAGPEPLTPTQHKLHSGSWPRLHNLNIVTSQHGLRS